MPRATPASALNLDQPSGLTHPAHAPGGVAAVDRALSLLLAFESGERELSLAELARRTGLYKSTALRLLASLVHAGCLVRQADAYALGPALLRLQAQQADSFQWQDAVLPVLRELVAATRESAAFHVRRDNQRLCLYRVDSPQVLRDHIRAGDLLPLDRGAGGRVLLAFGQPPARGTVYDQIRRDGWVVLSGDRVPDLTGVSAPVFGPGKALAGALTLTLPTTRFMPEFSGLVLKAAQRLSLRLGAPRPA